MPTPRRTERSRRPHDTRWGALAVTLVVGFMSLLDVTIVNVAVPSMQQGLDASSAAIQWIVSGYALTFGLTLVAGGRLGDVVGRRRMFVIGLVAFTVTSAMAGLAPNEHLLVVARLLQGAAAGFLTPQNSGLIQQMFSGAERGRAFGLFGTTVGVSSATGPVIGGLIIGAFGEDQGWRYVFFVNVPIGIVAMVLALRLLPPAEPREGTVRSQIDGVGALLLGLAVLAVLLPIIEAMARPASPLWFLVLLAPVLGWAFVRWERRVMRRQGLRCSTSPCSPRRRVMRRGSCWGRRTSAGSRVSGWCSRSTSRTVSATRRSSPGSPSRRSRSARRSRPSPPGGSSGAGAAGSR